MSAVLRTACGWAADFCLASSWHSPAVLMKQWRLPKQDEQLVHFSGAGYWFAAQCGRAVPKARKSNRRCFLPASAFLRDTAIGLTMVIFFWSFTTVAVESRVSWVRCCSYSWKISNLVGLLNVGAETKTPLGYGQLQAVLSFAGGVYIIIPSGVRLINGKSLLHSKVIVLKSWFQVLYLYWLSRSYSIMLQTADRILVSFTWRYRRSVRILDSSMKHYECCTDSAYVSSPLLWLRQPPVYSPNAWGWIKGLWYSEASCTGLLITFLPAICMPVMEFFELR